MSQTVDMQMGKPPVNELEMFDKLEREPLWNRARDQIKDALLAGQFEPGSVLTLRALAEMFGTSVTPVRDAVNHLVAQGVLMNGPRNAAVVPDVGVASLKEITFVRIQLEGQAAKEAAAHANPELVEALTKQLEKMRELIRRRDLDTYLDAHRKFHFTIYRGAGIPLLHDVIENLWLRCGPILTYVIPEYVISLKGTDHHEAILRAIAAQDGVTAQAEIVADITEAASYLTGCADATGRIRPGAEVGEAGGSSQLERPLAKKSAGSD